VHHVGARVGGDEGLAQPAAVGFPALEPGGQPPAQRAPVEPVRGEPLGQLEVGLGEALVDQRGEQRLLGLEVEVEAGPVVGAPLAALAAAVVAGALPRVRRAPLTVAEVEADEVLGAAGMEVPAR
jgi:hypothetical protein